jgi:hypothetical protein
MWRCIRAGPVVSLLIGREIVVGSTLRVTGYDPAPDIVITNDCVLAGAGRGDDGSDRADVQECQHRESDCAAMSFWLHFRRGARSAAVLAPPPQRFGEPWALRAIKRWRLGPCAHGPSWLIIEEIEPTGENPLKLVGHPVFWTPRLEGATSRRGRSREAA